MLQILRELNLKANEILSLLDKLLKIAETQNAKLDEIIKSLNDITKILNGLDLKDDEIIQLLNKVISEIKDQKLKLEEILDYLSKKDERVAYPIPIKEEEKNHCLTFLNIQNLELKRGENELTILLQNCGDFIEENITIVLNFLDKVEYKYLLNIYPNEIKHLKFKIFVPYDFINGVANVYAYNLYNNIFAAFYIFSIPSFYEY